MTNFNDDLTSLIDAHRNDDTIDSTAARICMTAMRDLADAISHSANRRLADDYPFRIAFLDDDSDYMPAALDMMRDLMIALADDYAELACAAILDRITRDDAMITDNSITYSDLPLDAPCD